MTLQQLRYFLAAADRGSFSAAAEELLLAQPSLSEQIRRLEGELGVPLFVRAGRRLELTEAGRLFPPHAASSRPAPRQRACASSRPSRSSTSRPPSSSRRAGWATRLRRRWSSPT